MDAGEWLIRGTALIDNSRVIGLLHGNDRWQLYTTSKNGYILVVQPDLKSSWEKDGFINTETFMEMTFKDKSLFFFLSQPGQMISTVQNGPYPKTNVEARAFAFALSETRKVSVILSLQDAIFIEAISRLLPTYTQDSPIDDCTVLGTWLSGGVSISVDLFQRLCSLLPWMDTTEIAEIINLAGFEVNAGSYMCKQDQFTVKNTLDMHRTKQPQRTAMPNEKFSLPGRPYLEEFFNEQVIDIVKHEEAYRRMGIDFPSAIVLHGPPGCGKTFAAEKLVEYLGWPMYSVDSNSIGSSYIHETSKKISEIFNMAKENAPSVILIDEMEAFLTVRTANLASGTHHFEEVAEFLRRIPDAAKNKVLIIAMTNMIETIDPAILRRGRFDHIIEVKMPSQLEIKALLEKLLSNLPISGQPDITAISEKLIGRPFSDVTFVLKEAGRIAVKQNQETISPDMILSALKALPQLSNKPKIIGFNGL